MKTEEIKEKKKESKFLRWVWLLIVLAVFLETPRFLSLLLMAGMFGGVNKLFERASETADAQSVKWPYIKALTVCTLLALGFAWQSVGLIMVGLGLATVLELYILYKRPAATKEERCFDWACLSLTVAMLVCLVTGVTQIGIDVWH